MRIRCKNPSCYQYGKERIISRESDKCDYCGRRSVEILGRIEKHVSKLPKKIMKIKEKLPYF